MLIRIAGLAISALCLWLLFRSFRPAELWAHARQAHPVWLLPTFVTLGLFLAFNAMRWQSLLLPVARIPAWSLLRWQLIGYLANTILPLRAGELVRVALVARTGKAGAATVLATIFVEKVLDGVIVVGLFVTAMLVLDVPPWVRLMGQGGAALFASALVFLLVLSAGKQLPLVSNQRLFNRALTVATGALAVVPGPKALMLLLGRSALLWGAASLNTVCVLRAFDIPATIPEAMLLTAGISLAQIVPAGPAAIGTYELAVVAIVGVFGVVGAQAELAAIAMRAIAYAPPSIFGIAALWFQGLGIGDLRQRGATRTGEAANSIALPRAEDPGLISNVGKSLGETW